MITQSWKKENIGDGETHHEFGLAAGHALIAVLYLLVQCFYVVPELCGEGLMYESVEVSVMKLAKLLEKNEGYLPDVVEWAGTRLHLC
jgi:hypothetical protein